MVDCGWWLDPTQHPVIGMKMKDKVITLVCARRQCGAVLKRTRRPATVVDDSCRSRQDTRTEAHRNIALCSIVAQRAKTPTTVPQVDHRPIIYDQRVVLCGQAVHATAGRAKGADHQ